MVNVKNLFGMAVMATALVGCSSNDNLAPDGKDNVGKPGEAYASFKINLPTTNGSRAAGDPTFENGDKNEYAVKDATLLLFKKNDAGDFVFKEFVDLGNMEPWTSSSTSGSDITTTAKLTAKITKAEVGADKGYYALIVLNNNSKTAPKITYPDVDQTYADWSQKEANATDNYLKYDNGFFMANAPKYVAGAPETLVEIKNIYASKQQAENSTATTVYVERGLAKVSLASSSVEHVDIADGNYAGDKVDITGWTLDVTNTKTYPVHVTEGEGLWADTWKTTVTPDAITNGASMDRFHDTKPDSEFQRVYWGLDPNYSTNFADVTACEKEFKMATKENFKTGAEAKKAQYCLENTFDIDHMVQGQTTRVLFSAKYTPADFKAGETFYKFGNSPKLWHVADVEAQIKAKAQEILGEAVTVKLDAEGNNMTKSGVYLVDAANIITNGETALTPEKIDQINAKLGLKKATDTDAAVGLSTFESGVSYYIARVKHFNDLTPWKPGDKTYNGNNANWLGRYGVLRNNWYELTVSSVSGPGYPDIPKVNPTDPDDENKQFINVEVKILKWAKRSQSIEL